MAAEILPEMRLAAASAKNKGATKLEFKNSVRKSLTRMMTGEGATASNEEILGVIEQAEQAIDEIWDRL